MVRRRRSVTVRARGHRWPGITAYWPPVVHQTGPGLLGFGADIYEQNKDSSRRQSSEET